MSQLEVADNTITAYTERASSAYVPPLQRTEGQPPPIAAHGGLSYMAFDQDGDAGTAVAIEDALAEIAEGESQRVIDMIAKAPPGPIKTKWGLGFRDYDGPWQLTALGLSLPLTSPSFAGGALNEDDRVWYTKIGRAGIRQVFIPDVLPATLVALFVACSSCWMPYYLSTEKHWSTQEYSAFYMCWGIVGFFGLWLAGWLAGTCRML
jgi:hypothetical protein